jgi:hypothetical protein
MLCKIYVTGRDDLSEKELMSAIIEKVGHDRLTFDGFEKVGYSYSMRANDEYDKLQEKIFPDGFLYFKFIIEIEIDESIETENAAKEIGQLLVYLWSSYSAVAACDFEELLPENGGYKSLVAPWPKM